MSQLVAVLTHRGGCFSNARIWIRTIVLALTGVVFVCLPLIVDFGVVLLCYTVLCCATSSCAEGQHHSSGTSILAKNGQMCSNAKPLVAIVSKAAHDLMPCW